MIRNPEYALFLDMGLGKTVITLYALRRLIETGIVTNALVVCPLSVMYNVWRQEAASWDYTKDLVFSILHGPHKATRLRKRAHIYLINYEGLAWLARYVRTYMPKVPFDVLVLDESTKLKAPGTVRFRAFRGLAPQFKRRYILTGTPTPNSLMDLWGQFWFVDCGKTLGPSYNVFKNTFFNRVNDYKWVPQRGAVQKIARLIQPKAMRLAAEDYLDMPDIIYNRIPVTFPEDLQERYNNFERDFFYEMGGDEDEDCEAFNTATLGIKLRQFIQGGLYTETGEWKHIHDLKLQALKDVVDTSNRPILCAFQFRGEAEMFRKHFPKAPIVMGGMSVTELQRHVTRWNNGEYKLMFCQPRVLSHGMNLQAGGSYLLWYALTWDLGDHHQLIGRLYRQGQKNAVTVSYIVVRNTLDEQVLQVLKMKNATQKTLLRAIQQKRKEILHDVQTESKAVSL